MWLAEFLPEEFPNARIMTYGYNSNLVGDTVELNIADYKEQFIQFIANYRSDFQVHTFYVELTQFQAN